MSGCVSPSLRWVEYG